MKKFVLVVVGLMMVVSVGVAGNVVWRPTVGLDFYQYSAKIGDAAQTVGVHPDDSGFLSGTTTTDINDEEAYNMILKGGLDLTYTHKFLSLYVGAELGLNCGYLTSQSDRSGLHDTKQQSSDNRVASSGSFVYSQIYPSLLHFMPVVGADLNLSSGYHVGFRYGLPITRWTIVSGHDRYATWDQTYKDSDTDVGEYIGIETGWVLDDGFNVVFTLYRSTFDVEFADEPGEINVYGISLCARLKF